MARRVVSLWLPRFATDRLCRLEPGLRAEPLAIAATLGNSRLVLAANMVAEAGVVVAGLPLADAARLCASTPAGQLGLTDRGRLSPGFRADFVVLSPRLVVRQTWIGGRLVKEH